MIRIKHGSGRETAHIFFDLCKQQVKAGGMDTDQTYFVYPVGGFGEFTFVSSLLPELRKKAKVALFLPQHKIDYFEMFPQSADFVLHYGPQFGPCLPDLFHQGMCKPGYPFVPFTDWIGDGRFNMELVTKEGRLTLKEGYAYMMGLPLTTPGVQATVPAGGPAAGLEGPGKRLLIIPHANSHKPFDPSVWQILAERFQAAGYTVYFEVTNYQAALPAGVQTLSLTPKALLQSLVAFDAVVALRSGLTDLMGTVPRAARGKVAIVYHVTDTPPAEEQRFNHAAGVARSGLALTRIFPGDASLKDIEVNGDRIDPAELDQVVDFVLAGPA
jgi:hypothetical protein